MLKKRTFNWDMSNLSDSKLGKTIQKSTVSFSIYIQLDWEYLTTQLDPRWTMKLQHLQTIQTCHCHRMSGTWHLPSNRRSIQWSPPHTRPWPPRHQSGSFLNRCLRQRRLSSVPRPRPGGSDRLRLASRSWFLPSKPDHWNPTNNSHSTERYRICLIQNLKKQYPFSIYIFADNSTRSEMNDETIQHLQTIQTCHCHRMSGTWHLPSNRRGIQWSPSHTPGLGPLVANLVFIQIDLRNALVDFKCLGQGLEAATGQGWRLDFKGPTDKTWFLKCSKKGHSTETCPISLIQTLEKQSRNPRFHSLSTYIGSIWQLNSIRDERWSYSTCKQSKLVTVTGCPGHDIFHQIAAAFSGAHHTPGLGALGTNLVLSQIDVCDRGVYLQCLGQGLEAATD